MRRMNDPSSHLLQNQKDPKLKGGNTRLIYAQNASASPKLSVLTSVVDFMDTELSEGRGAHDAWLNRHVENCVFEKVRVPGDDVVLWSERWV